MIGAFLALTPRTLTSSTNLGFSAITRGDLDRLFDLSLFFYFSIKYFGYGSSFTLSAGSVPVALLYE